MFIYVHEPFLHFKILHLGCLAYCSASRIVVLDYALALLALRLVIIYARQRAPEISVLPCALPLGSWRPQRRGPPFLSTSRPSDGQIELSKLECMLEK